jgi:hypothetical protein
MHTSVFCRAAGANPPHASLVLVCRSQGAAVPWGSSRSHHHRRATVEVLLTVSRCANPNPSPFIVAAYSSPAPHHARTILESPRPLCRLPSMEHSRASMSSASSRRRPRSSWSGPQDLAWRSHGTVANREVKTSLSSGPCRVGY